MIEAKREEVWEVKISHKRSLPFIFYKSSWKKVFGIRTNNTELNGHTVRSVLTCRCSRQSSRFFVTKYLLVKRGGDEEEQKSERLVKMILIGFFFVLLQPSIDTNGNPTETDTKRHQLANNRLKNLIQSRQGSKGITRDTPLSDVNRNPTSENTGPQRPPNATPPMTPGPDYKPEIGVAYRDQPSGNLTYTNGNHINQNGNLNNGHNHHQQQQPQHDQLQAQQVQTNHDQHNSHNQTNEQQQPFLLNTTTSTNISTSTISSYNDSFFGPNTHYGFFGQALMTDDTFKGHLDSSYQSNGQDMDVECGRSLTNLESYQPPSSTTLLDLSDNIISSMHSNNLNSSPLPPVSTFMFREQTYF